MPGGARSINRLTYTLGYRVVALIFNRYFRTHVSGRENLPPPGEAVIAITNHSSSLDPFVFGYALARPGHFVAKIEATRWPLMGPFLLSVGAIPARRDRRDTEVLRQLVAVLEAGGLVGVAPEGTRSRDGRLHPYDPGFMWLALKTGARVVPGAIHGAQSLMPRGGRLPRPGEIWVRFGEAMTFPDESARPGRDRLVVLAEEARQRTLALLADLSAESGIPDPAVEAERE